MGARAQLREVTEESIGEVSRVIVQEDVDRRGLHRLSQTIGLPLTAEDTDEGTVLTARSINQNRLTMLLKEAGMMF